MSILAWPARKNADRNPYQLLLYDAIERETGRRVVELSPRALLGRTAPYVLHLHWPDVFLAAGRGWRFWPRYAALRATVLVARARRTPVVWTVHNLRRDGQRNAARLERHFWPWFLRRIDGVIYLTEASADRAAASEPRLRDKRSVVIPHGHYRPVLGPGPADAAEPDGVPTVLFFGTITRYKNAAALLRAFVELPAGTARLVVCGEMSRAVPDEEFVELLASLPEHRRQDISYDDRFLSDESLARTIRGADVVAFPYRDVVSSGAAIYALSCGRPILTSDADPFRELRQLVGEQWVWPVAGELSGSDLEDALARGRELRRRGLQPDLSALDWTDIAHRTAEFFGSLRSPRRAVTR
jgi:beta-1,4-mannosyltransferase